MIGAGAAGLMAAWELVQTGRKTAVIEAKDRIGGRIHTIHDPRYGLPVELGAEFVHGNLELTTRLLKKAGIDRYEVSGELWQNHDGRLEQQKDFVEDYRSLHKKLNEVKEDLSVAAFMEQYIPGKEWEEARFTLKNYVEGYYAAETGRVSTFALREELEGPDEEQYRIEGGYGRLTDYLHRSCEEIGTRFFLSQPVTQIRWAPDEVEVITARGAWKAKKALITVPIGVLQAESIDFSPAIPEVIAAAKQLGFGPVIKTILQFEEAFWKNREITRHKDLDQLGFVFSKALIPTWWTAYPREVPMITGWSGGPHANELKDLSEDEVIHQALRSLAEIFRTGEEELRAGLRAAHVAGWLHDPFCRGGYSYEVVDGKRVKAVLKKGIENTLFFAGEGLLDGPEIGTVEAALRTGRDMAHEIIARFKT